MYGAEKGELLTQFRIKEKNKSLCSGLIDRRSCDSLGYFSRAPATYRLPAPPPENYRSGTDNRPGFLVESHRARRRGLLIGGSDRLFEDRPPILQLSDQWPSNSSTTSSKGKRNETITSFPRWYVDDGPMVKWSTLENGE